MTIHGDHPFLPATSERDPLRQWRGRMPAPVSVWTTVLDGRPTGWTISSFLLADGQPPEVLGLVDEEADFADQLARTGRFAVSLLGGQHRQLADVFAGQAPAPGGTFTVGRWHDTAWGPVLDDAVGWLGATVTTATTTTTITEREHAGWALLVRGVVEHLAAGEPGEQGVLTSYRGRYTALGTEGSGGRTSLRP